MIDMLYYTQFWHIVSSVILGAIMFLVLFCELCTLMDDRFLLVVSRAFMCIGCLLWIANPPEGLTESINLCFLAWGVLLHKIIYIDIIFKKESVSVTSAFLIATTIVYLTVTEKPKTLIEKESGIYE